MELKHLDFAGEFKILPGEDDEFIRIKGLASTFGNTDEQNDIMLRGAFVESLKVRKPVLLFGHDFNDPLGAIDRAEETEAGLEIEARIPRDLTKASDVLKLINVGALTGLSVGMRVLDDDFNRESGIRSISKADLFEVSIVTIPANPMARITAAKAVVSFQDLPLAPVDRSWDSSAALKRVRDFTESDDEPTVRYKSAFVQFDSDNSDEFGSYKLPIADVIDGSLKAVPRGVFAAAAAVQGARGGVNIPAADRKGVISHLEKYYDKMGRESPFQKGLGAQEVKAADFDILAGMFKNGTRFSKSGVDAIMTLIKGRREGGQPDGCRSGSDPNGRIKTDASADFFSGISELSDKIAEVSHERTRHA